MATIPPHDPISIARRRPRRSMRRSMKTSVVVALTMPKTPVASSETLVPVNPIAVKIAGE